MNHCYQNIPGWFDFQDVYAQAARDAADGDSFVEVGAWQGRSTAFMAVEIANSGKRIAFDVVDTWEGNEGEPETYPPPGKTLRELFDANMLANGLVVNAVQATSVAAACGYSEASLAFVYIDADHTHEAVLADCRAWWPKVKPAGTMAGHDIGRVSVINAVFKFAAETGFGVKSQNTSWIIKKPY